MVEVSRELENRILSLLENKLLSVTQVAEALGIRKEVASGILETLRQQGKLEMYVVGKSYVYTLPRRISKPVEKKVRVIGIVSGKGGVGKTTITINLALALQKLGQNVVVVDSDVRMCGVGLQLGMYYFPITLNHVLKEGLNILEALYIHQSGLRIIPASLAIEEVEVSKLEEILQNPALQNSLVLVDSPPGLETNAKEVIKACSEIIVVVTPDLPSLTDAIKVIDFAKENNIMPIGAIINRVRKRDKHQLTEEEIRRGLELPILGSIPEDKKFEVSLFKKLPLVSLYPSCEASKSFHQIASKLLGPLELFPK